MSRLFFGAGFALATLLMATTTASAQLGGAAAAPTAAAAPAVAGATGAAGAADAVKPGCLEKICVRCEAFRRKLCVTPAGALINNMTKPLSALTGGIIPPFCPILPSPKDLAKPGVAGAAAEGKKDAAEAKARQMDVRYLGTLDCRYYPNASKGLSDALRTDPSECVRFEAASALSRGCCCNKITLAALEASVSGMELDGNPAERSVRVRCTAAIALEKCLACYVVPAPEPEPVDPKKGQEGPKGEGPPKKDDEKDKDAKPPLAISPTPVAIAHARKTLIAFQELYANTLHPAPANGSTEQSLFSILKGNQIEPAPRMVVSTLEPTPTMPEVAPGKKTVADAPSPLPLKPAQSSAPVIQFLKVEPAVPAIDVPAVMPQSAKPVETAPKLTPTVTPASHSLPATKDATAADVLNCAKQLLLNTSESEKHAAVRALVKYEWVQHPRVASALLAGAASDQPAAVRVDCIRHLAHHNIAHPQVLADLQSLSGDADAWVKQEATKALAQLKAGQ